MQPSRWPHCTDRLSIRELPRSERPRERLRRSRGSGAERRRAARDRRGCRRRRPLGHAVGQAILESAGGSLRRIAAQPVAALTAVHGVGAARAAAVHAALELGRRMASEGRGRGAPVRSPRDVYAAFAAAAGGSAGRGVPRCGARLATPVGTRHCGHARNSEFLARASARSLSRGDRGARGRGHPRAQSPER